MKLNRFIKLLVNYMFSLISYDRLRSDPVEILYYLYFVINF